MRAANDPLITNQILNASFNSQAISLNQIFGYAIQGVITGTPTGTVSLQASNDPNSISPTNWSTITGTSQSVAAAGTFFYNVADVEYTWMRLVYTDGSSGSSTAVMNAVFNLKGF